jgi:hypothetical protein
MSVEGQSLPGRAAGNSSYVGYAPKAEETRRYDMPLRVDGDVLDVISSQRPVERWAGAASGNLARTLSNRLRGVKRFGLKGLAEGSPDGPALRSRTRRRFP